MSLQGDRMWDQHCHIPHPLLFCYIKHLLLLGMRWPEQWLLAILVPSLWPRGLWCFAGSPWPLWVLT